MRKLGLILPLFFLIGCGTKTEIETSPIYQEGGTVVDTLHTLPHSSADIHVGADFNGNLVLTPTSVSIPETWGVVFRCDHGNKFAIQGSKPKYKLLWEKLDTADEVTIYFKEIHRVTKEKRDGTWIESSRDLIDYDFIDADPLDTQTREPVTDELTNG